MPENTFTLAGTYIDRGKIRLANGEILRCEDLEAPSEVPYGASARVTIVLDTPDFLHGFEGAVWATYDRYQAEVVQGTLQSQKISCDLREVLLNGEELYAVHVRDPAQAEEAMDFIWREPGGLMLQPDWSYPAGALNESFLKWLEEE